MTSTPARGARRRRLRAGIAAAATVALSAGLTAVMTTRADAATGCRVAYSVNQWPGGFTGNVALTNLGDPLNGWTLRWSFANGQTVSQGWGGNFSQSGAQVTVTNASWNAGPCWCRRARPRAARRSARAAPTRSSPRRRRWRTDAC